MTDEISKKVYKFKNEKTTKKTKEKKGGEKMKTRDTVQTMFSVKKEDCMFRANDYFTIITFFFIKSHTFHFVNW